MEFYPYWPREAIQTSNSPIHPVLPANNAFTLRDLVLRLVGVNFLSLSIFHTEYLLVDTICALNKAGRHQIPSKNP